MPCEGQHLVGEREQDNDKTGSLLLSLNMMGRNHEVTMIAINVKEIIHTKEFPGKMSVSLPWP